MRYLEKRGWTVVERNYRLGHREIDLIVRCGSLVAFVEVKGRTGAGYGHPLHAITAAKQREIERVARSWVFRHARPGDTFRYDAIAVLHPATGGPIVEHIEDAWRL